MKPQIRLIKQNNMQLSFIRFIPGTWICILGLVLGACGTSGSQIEQDSKNGKDDKPHIEKVSVQDDTTIVKKIITRVINGKEVKIPLTGKTDFVVDEFIDHTSQEIRLKVEEVQPGVLLFNKYFQDTITDPHYDETYFRKKPVPDRIEFFDSKYNLINSYVIDANNPYLTPEANVEVREYFSDLEHFPHYTYGDWKEGERIIEHHLQTGLCEESLVVSYSKKEVSNKGRTRRDVTTLNFLNPKGELIFSVESDDNPRCPAVDTSFNYAIITYHPFLGPNRTEGKSRFEIWDLKKGQLIHIEKEPFVTVQNKDINASIGAGFSKEYNRFAINIALLTDSIYRIDYIFKRVKFDLRRESYPVYGTSLLKYNISKESHDEMIKYHLKVKRTLTMDEFQ